MRGIFVALATVSLTACVAGGGTSVPTDVCGAANMQSFVGQPESALKGSSFTGPVRILHPNDAATMDYSGGRINFVIDANGVISRVYCG
jgi:hypothetical protein